jgi:signal transduction histidine kinase
MLKRLKVRSKLLVLVITPLIALAAFAANGVNERLESADFFSREERIAELADAGADLTLAIHVERIQTLLVDGGGTSDIGSAVVATDNSVEHWLDVASAAGADLSGPVAEDVEDFAIQLNDALEARARSDMGVRADELLRVGRDINSITIGLISETRDLQLNRAMSEYLQLSRVQFAIADITSIGARSIVNEEITTGDFALLEAADATVDGSIQQFRNFASPALLGQLNDLTYAGLLPVSESTDPSLELQIAVNRPDRSGALVEWLEQGEERLVAIHDLSTTALETASGSSALAASEASDQARNFIVLAGVVVIAALALAVIVGRSISRPLRKLTVSAERLSSEELPALVEAMRQGAATTEHNLTPIDTRGRDEVAQLANALSDIQDVTLEVAEEQGELLRRGISDMFVNLARRNQSLLDRQIEFIDQLESAEENPDTLENLFRLDHLATRMRRNAESLLVLAGAESTRRRGQAVEIVDVIRVAMGEIEDFSRVRMTTIEPATVAGSVAVDLAHLLSELMENSSQFSPPDTPVEVIGQRTQDGTYQVTITDHGIGLSPEQLIEANHVLANPPVVGLELGRSLGFTVVSRLAHRLGISVRLTTPANGGVIANVSIPDEMTGEISSSEPVAEAPDVLHASGLAAASSEPIDLPDPTVAGPGLDLGVGEDPAVSPEHATPRVFSGDPLFDLGAGTPVPTAPAEPEILADPDQAVVASGDPAGDLFDALGTFPPRVEPSPIVDQDIFESLDTTPTTAPGSGLPQRRRRPRPHESDVSSLAPPPAAPGPIARPARSEMPADETPAPPPTPAASVGAVDASVTSAGLIRRTPRSESQPDPSGGSSTASSVRSPEEVRQMLSRYRTGLRRGRETPNS